MFFNDVVQIVRGEDAEFHDFGAGGFHRYLMPVPEEFVGSDNFLGIFNPTPTPFLFSAFIDSGPIEKIDSLFADGFESGDTSAWSTSIPFPVCQDVVRNGNGDVICQSTLSCTGLAVGTACTFQGEAGTCQDTCDDAGVACACIVP